MTKRRQIVLDGTYFWGYAHGGRLGSWHKEDVSDEKAASLIRETFSIPLDEDVLSGFLNKGFLEVSPLHSSLSSDMTQVLYRHDFTWYVFTLEKKPYRNEFPKQRFDPTEVVKRMVGNLKVGPDRVWFRNGKEYRSPGFDLRPLCPKCGAPECHPTNPDAVLVRGTKVTTDKGTFSQCLVCASSWSQEGGYDEKLEWSEPFVESKKNAGWFRSG